MITTNIVEKVNDLPTLPTLFHEVSEVTNDPRRSYGDISRIIERDQVITAKILKLINSAFYGMPRKITTVERSITLLGLDAIKNLILSASVFENFESQEEMKGLWLHALATAVAAKIIGQHIKYRDIEELFICGLLHDIGKVVQHKLYPDEVKIIRERCRTDRTLYCEAEKEFFDDGHARIGDALLSRWKLPERIKSVVRLHHRPHPDYKFAFEITIVYLANNLAKRNLLGDSWNGGAIPKVEDIHLQIIGLDRFPVDELSQTLETEVMPIAAIFL